MNNPDKPIENLTPEELYTFRNSFDCDSMGFRYEQDSEIEGVNDVKHSN